MVYNEGCVVDAGDWWLMALKLEEESEARIRAKTKKLEQEQKEIAIIKAHKFLTRQRVRELKNQYLSEQAKNKHRRIISLILLLMIIAAIAQLLIG